MKPEIALALLLAAGHLIGDFVLQPGRIAEGKQRFPVMLLHGVIVFLASALVAWPFWSARFLAALGIAAAIHMVIDAFKVRAAPSLRAFLLDQALHGAVLIAVWRWLSPGGYSSWFGGMMSGSGLPLYVWSVAMVGLVGFNLIGGSTLVRLALGPTIPSGAGRESLPARGAMIGYLERIMVMVLVLVGQWGVIGLVMAAKSLARFKDLDERGFAEYYLIGTLTSLLVAITAGMAAGWAMDLCRLVF